MGLRLYRRHRSGCEAGRPENDVVRGDSAELWSRFLDMALSYDLPVSGAFPDATKCDLKHSNSVLNGSCL